MDYYAGFDKAIKSVVRRLKASLGYPPQFDDEYLSAANRGVTEAYWSFNPSRGLTLHQWLVWAGYRRSICLFLELARKKVYAVRLIPVTDLMPFGGMDRFPAKRKTANWQRISDLLEQQCEASPDNDVEQFIARLGKKLSERERKALFLHASGQSYEEIAKEIHRDFKSVDNCLQRVRHKATDLAKFMSRTESSRILKEKVEAGRSSK